MKKFINFGKHKSVQSLLGDSFWTLFSQAFIVVVNILSVYILANLLSQHNYGEFKLITTWLAIALGVGYTGYSYLLPQKIAKGEKYELGEIFKETFIKSLPTLLGLLAIAFYYLFKANLNLGVGFLFASVLAPVLCISTLVNTYYMGRRNFKMFALAQNFVDFVQLVVMAAFAYFSDNFILIVSAYFIATIVANLLIVLKAISDDKKIKLEKENINLETVQTEIGVYEKKMQSKLNISGIVLGFSNQIDKLLIFHFIGAVPLAVYSITTAMSDQARTPVKAITSAMFPRMTKADFTKKKLLAVYIGQTLVCIAIALTLVAAYPFLFKYIFPKYVDYIYLANLATLSIVFAPTQFLYIYSQSKNDLQTLNTYAYINTVLQIVLYTLSAVFVSLPMFLISRAFIMFATSIYQLVKIYKN